MKLFVLVHVIAFLGFCSTTDRMTVAPKPVAVHEVSSWAKKNVIDSDRTGVIVTADYVRVYKALLADYGKKLSTSSQPASPDDGIEKRADGNYHVTYEVSDRFADLKYFERNSGP
jgi:hypothetical protein